MSCRISAEIIPYELYSFLVLMIFINICYDGSINILNNNTSYDRQNKIYLRIYGSYFCVFNDFVLIVLCYLTVGLVK